MDLENLYVLINDDRPREALDLVLDFYYEDENPLDTIIRVAQETGLAGGKPIPPAPNTQIERIDCFLNKVDRDKLNFEMFVGIIMFSIPYMERLSNIENFLNTYNERFKDKLEKEPCHRFNLKKRLWGGQ